MRGRVLIIAGSDSSGGAGIQADIKTVTALGGYASTAITALTAQNTLGVFGVVGIDPEFVRLQIQVVLEDVGADAIKLGMLHDERIVEVVAECLAAYFRSRPVVVDPVLLTSHGAALLSSAGRDAVRRKLLPVATLITPNAPEAGVLTGIEVRDLAGMQHAADRLLLMGPEAVLIKGGHVPGERVIDLLRTADGFERVFESARIETTSSHGTGCTLASAIAVGLAEGMTLEGSIQEARSYVLEAMRRAPGYGQGIGPLNHAHPVLPTQS